MLKQPVKQGCSSTKIVWGAKASKNVGHHGWLTEKILGFKWAKMTQMALKRLRFSRTFLNMFRMFLVCQNNFCKACFFYKGIFLLKSRNLRNVLFKIKPCISCINFYIKSFSGSTNTIVVW